jgi:hypothetical protein
MIYAITLRFAYSAVVIAFPWKRRYPRYAKNAQNIAITIPLFMVSFIYLLVNKIFSYESIF